MRPRDRHRERGPALRFPEFAAPAWNQYGIAVLAVLGVTLVGFVVRAFTGYQSVSLLYLFTVVLLALFIGRGPILFAPAASALLWNFLFLPPQYTLYITKVEDALMFGMFFVVALTMGQLTARIRAQAAAERGLEQRATALYLLTRSLAESKDPSELLAVAVRLLGETFHADVAVLLPATGGAGKLVAYPFGTLALTEKEEGVADWAFRNAKPAGRGTDTLASAESVFLPLVTPGGCIGVAGPRSRQDRVWSLPENNLLESFSRQIALVLDRARLRDAETRAALLAESERLGRTLLNRLREWTDTPVIVLTVQEAEAGKIAALDAGADDYVTKPFNTGELLARLRAALRRAKKEEPAPVFTVRGVVVDLATHRVTRDGRGVPLTATEWSLLRLLVRHAGKVLTHRQILREVWGAGHDEDTHYLRVYMAHLREKLEANPAQPELFITEPGVGYRLVGNP